MYNYPYDKVGPLETHGYKLHTKLNTLYCHTDMLSKEDNIMPGICCIFGVVLVIAWLSFPKCRSPFHTSLCSIFHFLKVVLWFVSN